MSQNLRVLVLATDAFGAYGGIAQYVRDFAVASAQSPLIDQIVILPRLAPFPLEKLPPNVSQSAPVKSKIRYGIAALFAAVVNRPNVIVCGHLYHGPLALRIARLMNAKLVSFLYGDEIWQGIPERHLLPLRQSNLVISCSADTANRVVAAGVEPERAAVLHCTVQNNFTPGDRGAARRSFGIADEDTVILTVARLDGRADAVGYKGHDQVIPLVAALKCSGMRIKYLIAGIGEDQSRLEAIVAQQGVGDSVRFLGKVPHQQLPDLYRAADLFAMPSSGEGFGIAFVEAMACGTAAIGLAIGGAPDALDHGALGRCVEPDEFPQAFAEEVARCRQRDPSLPQRVRALFGHSKFSVRTHALIAALAAQGVSSNSSLR